jgi:hypothetical protein
VDRHRHRFDADPDPNPIFHFDADQDPDPDPDRILLHVLHMLENQKIYFAFFLFTTMPVYIVLPFFSASQISKFSIFWTVY